MPAQILLLGRNKDYYGVDMSHEGIEAASHKAFENAHRLTQGEAFLENLADCSVVIPAERLYTYGAPFLKDVAAAAEQTLAGRLERLFHELLAEADGHQADYVLIQSLEFKVGHFAGGEVCAWAQMLNARS